MTKRNRIDIIQDILSLLNTNKKLKPTHLMYKSNLSHPQMKSYLNKLKKREFISEIIGKKNHKSLIITKRGLKFLEKIKEMKEFEDTFGLGN